MNIPAHEWQAASGSLVQDDDGGLWRIIGFLDRPTVILEPIKEQPRSLPAETDLRQRAYQVMGSETSKRFHRLVREANV